MPPSWSKLSITNFQKNSYRQPNRFPFQKKNYSSCQTCHSKKRQFYLRQLVFPSLWDKENCRQLSHAAKQLHAQWTLVTNLSLKRKRNNYRQFWPPVCGKAVSNTWEFELIILLVAWVASINGSKKERGRSEGTPAIKTGPFPLPNGYRFSGNRIMSSCQLSRSSPIRNWHALLRMADLLYLPPSAN